MTMPHASDSVTTLRGRYVLRRQIAHGGMGVVWEATDDVLGRSVAVKALSPALAADQRFVERFRREARAAAGLSHANVAQVFDYGEDGPTRFIVMELVEGETLAARLRREGRLAPAEAARIGAQAADALEAAHLAGIVHRDVKPGNIMLATDGSVKVMDFGIAAAAYGSSLTATGSMLGTAAYMSPERVSGKAATPASDVYSLSVVVYEALTGAPPFDLETPVATAAAHVHTAPVPVRTLARDVPAPLAAAVERALEKDPAARPASAAAFAALLRTGVATADGASSAAAPTQQLRVHPTDRLTMPPTLPPTEPRARPQTAPRTARPPRRRLNRAILIGAAIAALLAWALIAALAGGGTPTPPAAQSSGRASPSPSVEATVAVPASVIGMSVKDATSALNALGISVSSVVRVDSPPDTPENVVMRTDPGPGARLGPDAGVTLFVSDSHGHGPGKKHGHGDENGNGHGNGHGGDGEGD
jgi:eukaryotic-like serine/threonine-protein kinase